MKLLKIKAYQEFVNYRIPNSYKTFDTYFLPTPSSLRGWFHYVIGAKEYVPMAVSIHGKYESIVHDLQRVIKLKYSKEGANNIIFNDKRCSLINDIVYVATLYCVNLTLYIKAEEKYLYQFIDNVFNLEYPTLGRKEDLIRIDYIDVVDFYEKEFSIFDPYIITGGMYLNKNTIDEYDLNLIGTHYRLDFKYHKKYFKSKIGVRYFEKRDVVYIDSGLIENGKFLYDETDDKIIDLIGD